MYSLRDYGSMVGDDVRTAAYVEALRRSVKPGSVVVDIGTGSGVMAMTACRFGARRVYAVEPDDVIEVAREIAAANGYADRVEFIQAFSTEIDLPERADVVVAEIHGVLPLFGRSLATLMDARERFLAPGGTIVPRRETVFASVVQAAELYGTLVSPWSASTRGLDMRAGRPRVINNVYRTQYAPGDLLANPVEWASLDYMAVTQAAVAGTVMLTATHAATAHGIGLWFESLLAEGVVMSNAPGNPPLIFGNAFLPWPEAVPVAEHDVIEVEIRATPLDDRYIWQWNSRVMRAGSELARFRQSQFDGAVIVPEKLKRQAASRVARLNAEGEMQRAALTAMGEGKPLGDVARELQRLFPQRFGRWQDALNFVGELALRCSD